MRKIVITMIIAFMSMGAYAQTAQSEIELFQAAFGVEKAQMVMAFVKPGEEYKATFEVIYNEYESQRKALGQQSIELLNEYSEIWSGMTNEQAEAFMAKVIKLRKEREKLLQTYYNKLKKQTTPIIAAQFYQVETYILAKLQGMLYDNIPFIGETE